MLPKHQVLLKGNTKFLLPDGGKVEKLRHVMR